MLLAGFKQFEYVEQIAQKLCQTVETNFVIGGININLLMSIGIVHFPQNGDKVDSLLQKAEVALAQAKHLKGCSVETYSPELDTHSPRKLTLMSDLYHAIHHSELLLHYQPKGGSFPSPCGGLRGTGVLAASPARSGATSGVLPGCRAYRVIVPMTYWIADQALVQCAKWQGANSDIDVAVNVPVSVLLDRDLPKRLMALLHKHGQAARRLVVEITESSLMEDLEQALHQLTLLSSMGIRISIDDFGTGYSSLAACRSPRSRLTNPSSWGCWKMTTMRSTCTPPSVWLITLGRR